MTSLQHAKWLASGLHWRLARPLVALRDRLRHYGYTVYDVGDPRHLDAEPPEDHTPYSETGWPGTTPYGWVTAVDIMPPPAGSGLPSLLDLGLQIERDWPGWLKYMNRPTNLANTRAVHVSRQPDPASRSSGDVGHIHLSCRSDVTLSRAGDGYDPVAHLRGQSEEDIMAGLTDEEQKDLYRRVRNAELILWYGVKGGEDSVPESLVAGTAASPVPLPAGAPLELVKTINGQGVVPTPEQWASLTAAVEAKVASAIAAALDPATLAQAAFDGAQRAERE